MSGVERVGEQPAYILLRRAYRDSSLLLEALTRDHGRIGMIARGARASARGGSPQLLQRYRLRWQRRGELATLTAAEVEGLPPRIGGERTLWMWYANELLLRALARDDPHAEVFEAYARLLDGLAGAEGAAGAQRALRGFELTLLGALGYHPGPAETIDAAARYDYDAGRGAVPAPEGALSGAALRDALAGRLDTAAAAGAARAIFQAHLPELIGDRPLQTPAMLRRLRSLPSESS